MIKQITKEAKDYYEVHLAWARKTSTGWTKRKSSRDALLIEKLFNRDERSMFTFKCKKRTNLHNNKAQIEVFAAKQVTESVAIPDSVNTAVVDQYWSTTNTGNLYWRLQINADAYVTYNSGRNARINFQLEIIGIRWESDVKKTTGWQQGSFSDSYIPQISYPIHLDVFRPISGMKLKASAFGQTLSVDIVPITLMPYIGERAVITVNFAFKNVEDPEANWINPQAPLPMLSIGYFSLESGSDGKWQKVDSLPLIYPINNSYFWSGGALEISGGGISPFNPGFPEPMFLLSSSNSLEYPEHIYYIEEGGQRIFVRKDASGNLINLYPFGYSEASLYMRLSTTLDKLYSVMTQVKGENTWFGVDSITQWVGPTKINHDPRDNLSLGFDLSIPNAGYNWEVFYHLPIAAAIFLSRQHRFEDARRWFHYIFDPTTNDPNTGRERFWRFLPFRNAQAPDTITQLLEALAGKPGSHQTNIQDQVAAWLQDPFNPFAVARLRPSAFEWYTVIAYVKNLIAWADQLFRRDTRESINEATLLYIMAAQILGPRPEKIRANKGIQQPLSYRALVALKGDLNSFSNVWLRLADNPIMKALIEAMIKYSEWLAQHGVYNPHSSRDEIDKLSSIGSLYFCVPPNEKISELWDTVEDKLFKIRHCQNIEGITRSLDLYEQPIDPELLIRAKAAGLDLADVLADRFAPLPHYRFQILLQKANEFCNEVKSLGGAILSSIEKREAEHLALLRSSQEIDMLKLIESVKEGQVKEADANIEALNKTRNNALERFIFLQRQLGQNQTKFDATGSPIVEQSLMTQVQETGMPNDFRSLSLIQSEINQIVKLQESNNWALLSSGIKAVAGTLHAAGVWPTTKQSAEALGFAVSAVSDGLSILVTDAAYQGGRFGMLASWQRRRDEWVQQSKMTAEEIRQINKQIVALEIRKSITEKELENHRKQIEHTQNIDDYLRHMKFSGESLYGWMESQLAGLYFSAYQLAYDLAKKAERAYQFELGEPSSSFIQFGHWDNLRKGLLSGERLSQNLRRLEAAHIERNKRELEITKHISLRQLDPLALINLRKTGECEFDVPEVLFDLDFPGHYFRRIKSVSVSVPCVVGPYSSVSGTLTLLSSKLRDDYKASASDYLNEDKYKASYLPVQSIATSSGQNDAGVFELNFRDERYLPFEGAGVISRWRFKLPENFRSFDYTTISDIVLHFRYTARSGGESLALVASGNAKAALNKLKVFAETDGLWQFIDLRHDYPEEWHRYNKSTSDNAVSIKLGHDRFPFMLRGKNITVQEIKHSTLPNREVSITIDTTKETVDIPLQERDFEGKDAWIVLRYSI